MKQHSSRLSIQGSYEDFEKQLARDLGLSCSLDSIRGATASFERRRLQPQNESPTEREQVERMFAGKSMSESLELYRANKDRVRRFLGLTAKTSSAKKGSRFIHRSYK
jgi:hypothetical protein